MIPFHANFCGSQAENSSHQLTSHVFSISQGNSSQVTVQSISGSNMTGQANTTAALTGTQTVYHAPLTMP